MSRAYTEQEVIEKMMRKFRSIAHYWATTPLGSEHRFNGPEDELRWRCDGVAFTILAEMDGSSMNLPAMDIVLAPHPDDKQYCIDHDENWFEPEMRISTALHEHFHKRG